MTKAKADANLLPKDTMLAASDHFALVMADKDAEIAQLQVRLAKATQREQRLAAQIQDQATQMAVSTAMATADNAARARKALAEKVAKAYNISWENHALEPLTGRIVALHDLT